MAKWLPWDYAADQSSSCPLLPCFFFCPVIHLTTLIWTRMAPFSCSWWQVSVFLEEQTASSDLLGSHLSNFPSQALNGPWNTWRLGESFSREGLYFTWHYKGRHVSTLFPIQTREGISTNSMIDFCRVTSLSTHMVRISTILRYQVEWSFNKCVLVGLNGFCDDIATICTHSVHRIDFVILFLLTSIADLSCFFKNYAQLLLHSHSVAKRCENKGNFIKYFLVSGQWPQSSDTCMSERGKWQDLLSTEASLKPSTKSTRVILSLQVPEFKTCLTLLSYFLLALKKKVLNHNLGKCETWKWEQVRGDDSGGSSPKAGRS